MIRSISFLLSFIVVLASCTRQTQRQVVTKEPVPSIATPIEFPEQPTATDAPQEDNSREVTATAAPPSPTPEATPVVIPTPAKENGPEAVVDATFPDTLATTDVVRIDVQVSELITQSQALEMAEDPENDVAQTILDRYDQFRRGGVYSKDIGFQLVSWGSGDEYRWDLIPIRAGEFVGWLTFVDEEEELIRYAATPGYDRDRPEGSWMRWRFPSNILPEGHRYTIVLDDTSDYFRLLAVENADGKLVWWMDKDTGELVPFNDSQELVEQVLPLGVLAVAPEAVRVEGGVAFDQEGLPVAGWDAEHEVWFARDEQMKETALQNASDFLAWRLQPVGIFYNFNREKAARVGVVVERRQIGYFSRSLTIHESQVGQTQAGTHILLLLGYFTNDRGELVVLLGGETSGVRSILLATLGYLNHPAFPHVSDTPFVVQTGEEGNTNLNFAAPVGDNVELASHLLIGTGRPLKAGSHAYTFNNREEGETIPGINLSAIELDYLEPRLAAALIEEMRRFYEGWTNLDVPYMIINTDDVADLTEIAETQTLPLLSNLIVLVPREE